MKIGVDARQLSRPLTGIGRYTLEMCRALALLPELSLHLYSPYRIHDDCHLDSDAVTIRTGSCKHSLLGKLYSEYYLPRWVKQDKIDVFWGPGHRLPRRLPKSVARVVTIQDLVWKYAGETMPVFSRTLERIQMPYAVRTADEVLASSEATANALKNTFTFDKENLTVLPLGVNFPDTPPSDELLKEKRIDKPYILFVGTLEPRKNLNRLLDAYSQLDESVKEKAMLVIVGGKGWGNVNIQEMMNQFNISKYVRSLTYVDDSLLAALYAHSLFLAMPSLYEGFGLPLLEAMAHGRPVLTSNNLSMPEVAGDAGLLIEPTEVESIKKGLDQLISDENFRDSLAEKAKDQAARFNWNESAKKLESIFNKAITRRRMNVR